MFATMTVHIVGAGLAGLSCALACADQGQKVVLHEAARQAGGRCRSWQETRLDRMVDNGTHMVVGANQALFGFLRRIGADHSLKPGPRAFPMLDLPSGRLWTATPARLIGSVLASTWLMPRRHDRSVGAALGHSRNYHRFWDPLALAIMNTPADQASALVFRRVLARTLWHGMTASQPFMARQGLTQSFVEPALAALTRAGVEIRFNNPLRSIDRDAKHIRTLSFDGDGVPLAVDDSLVLAVPWPMARTLIAELPNLPASPIVNAHFLLTSDQLNKATMPKGGMLGLLGGTGQWLFLRGDVVSVTVSGAGALVDCDADQLADRLWQDVATALSLDQPAAGRIVIKEKRATLFHTPEVEARRPQARQSANLLLAGDWTATGLPCTLEGAVISGLTAAQILGTIQ
jgi:squalene-associated FAD-dependent desaturase